MLTGTIEIVYKNNSPHFLKELYFHLWPNAYNSRKTALCNQMLEDGNRSLYFANAMERGWIDSLQFNVDGIITSHFLMGDSIDICRLDLANPIKPESSVIIKTPFVLKLPDAKFSRLGHTNQAYFITQWFPKPAVYDRNGWNLMPYLNQGEFYSEFGNFDVTITLPSNYVVAASGDLTTETELQWLNEKASKSYEVKHELSFPPSSSDTKTLHYVLENAHDFAWFADKRFNVQKGEITLPQSQRKVTAWAMFTNKEGRNWKNAIGYIKDAVMFYSNFVGDYGYNTVTALDGTLAAGGGMEYPTITIIGATGTDPMLDRVIAHEVGHNWFYGMLANNERKHPWMDEGMNSFVEMKYLESKYPPNKHNNVNELTALTGLGKLLKAQHLTDKEARVLMHHQSAITRTSQPLDLQADHFTQVNYGNMVYTKTALLFDELRQYLGHAVFDRCIHEYFEKFKFKHPYPQDVKMSFEKCSGKNLNWFFNQYFETSEIGDASIQSMETNGNQTTVVIKKNTIVNTPQHISFYKDNKLIKESWIDNKLDINANEFDISEFDFVELSTSYQTLDLNYKNNRMYKQGVCRKRNPVSIRFLSAIEQVNRSYYYWSPAVGYNVYDGFIAGLALHNVGANLKHVNFSFTPMYGFESKKIVGMGNVTINVYDANFGNAKIKVAASHFNTQNISFSDNAINPIQQSYKRLAPGLVLLFKNKNPRSRISRSIEFTSHIIKLINELRYESSSINSYNRIENYNVLRYTYENKRIIDPYNFLLDIESGFEYSKVGAAFQYHFTNRRNKKALSLRFFAGRMFAPANSTGIANLRMSGANGPLDYRHEYLFFGRNEFLNTAGQQFVEHEGGFKVYTPTADSDHWIAAINTKVTVPGLSIFYLFADVGTYHRAGKTFEGAEPLVYDAGIAFAPIRDVLEIYFPFALSNDIKQYYEVNDIAKYQHKIRFQCNLHLIKPLNWFGKIF